MQPHNTALTVCTLLIAQAFAEGLTVVTHDKRFAYYDLKTLPT